MRGKLIIAAVTSLALAGSTQAAEIKLLSSSAIKDAYLELLPLFEKATGHKVTAAWSSTPDIQMRIAAGEAADLVILGDSGTEELIKQGKLAANSRTNFAKSGIAVAVRAGAPKPDISAAMSALGQKQTFALRYALSDSPLKAGIRSALAHVRFGPIAYMQLVTRSANAAGRSPRARIRFANLHFTTVIGG